MAFTRKFYVSDTHFGHESIIGNCNRPFASAPEMDRYMIDCWNSTVGDDDIVFHLGDFAFGDEEYVRYIFHSLKGRKVLILGNHDFRNNGSVLPWLLDLPWDKPPTPAMETSDGGKRVYLSHYAHRVWPGSHKGAYHFFGHSHGRIPSVGNSRDIGVDLPDVAFTPRTFQELTSGLPGLQTNPEG